MLISIGNIMPAMAQDFLPENHPLVLAQVALDSATYFSKCNDTLSERMNSILASARRLGVETDSLYTLALKASVHPRMHQKKLRSIIAQMDEIETKVDVLVKEHEVLMAQYKNNYAAAAACMNRAIAYKDMIIHKVTE